MLLILRVQLETGKKNTFKQKKYIVCKYSLAFYYHILVKGFAAGGVGSFPCSNVYIFILLFVGHILKIS